MIKVSWLDLCCVDRQTAGHSNKGKRRCCGRWRPDPGMHCHLNQPSWGPQPPLAGAVVRFLRCTGDRRTRQGGESGHSAGGSSHTTSWCWVEVFMPRFGWVGYVVRAEPAIHHYTRVWVVLECVSLYWGGGGGGGIVCEITDFAGMRFCLYSA